MLGLVGFLAQENEESDIGGYFAAAVFMAVVLGSIMSGVAKSVGPKFKKHKWVRIVFVYVFLRSIRSYDICWKVNFVCP